MVKKKDRLTTNYQYTERGSSSISFNNLSHWKASGSLKMERYYQGPLPNCVNYEWTKVTWVFMQNYGCANFHGYLSDVFDASNNNGLISEDLLVT